jgi:hypothetical protein
MKRIVVIAMVAMFALAGAAYGGSKITGAQIKDGTVTSADIKTRSCRFGGEVHCGSSMTMRVQQR